MAPKHPLDPGAVSRSAARSPARQILGHRPGLPGSRSVVGGLLVAIALVGTWWVASGLGGTKPARYVVAAHTIGPGQELTPEDLTTAPLVLSPASAARAFRRPADVAGAIALGPLAPGELVQLGAVAPPTDGRAELSFAVERDWAVAGALRVGDLIDLYATPDDGESRRILDGVRVQRIDSADEAGLGAGGRQVITVAVPTGTDLPATVAATRAEALTVVRVTDDTAGPPR